MNYKAIIKKQSTIIAIAVICLTVATIGVSYALFFQVETNTNNQIVTAGTLNVEYGSGSRAITATELVPMSDEEALASNTMTGTIYIENTGTLPANYEVSIGNDTEAFNQRENANENDKLLSHEHLKIAAYLNGELFLEPTKLSELTKSVNDDNMYQLLTGFIDAKKNNGNSAITIVLKAWINEEAPVDIIGDFVYLKMDVTSEVDDQTKVISEDGSALTLANSKGLELADYKIYGNSVQDGTPTTKAPVEIQSVGDKTTNLFSKYTYAFNNFSDYTKLDNGFILTPTSTAPYQSYVSFKLSELDLGETYTFGVDADYDVSSGAKPMIRVGYFTSNYIWKDFNSITLSSPNRAKITFTIPEEAPTDMLDTYGFCFLVDYTTVTAKSLVNLTVTNISLEKGETTGEYEPYDKYRVPVKVSNETEEIITNIFLDEPLRKIGAYADYIDFASGNVVRNIKRYTLPGKTQFTGGTTGTTGWGGTNTVGFYQYVNGFNNGIYFFGKDYQPLISTIMSNYFRYRDYNYNYDYERMGISYATQDDGYFHLRVNKSLLEEYGSDNSSQTANITALKSWLTAMYDDGNPVIVDYVLKTPITTQINLPKALTVTGNAILEVDTSIQPSKLEVTYR